MEKHTTTPTSNPHIEELFRVGAHFGYSRARRHASVKPYLYGVRAGVDIIDLEQTAEQLEKAKAFVHELGTNSKNIIFVGTKHEAAGIIEAAAKSIGLPYVTERWLGGMLTNFSEMKKRLARMKELSTMGEKGGLEKYTKKERLMLNRELVTLTRNFGGFQTLESLPSAMFVIDPRAEHIAVEEARIAKIPVIAIANSDCNVRDIQYPIMGNDSGVMSLAHFVTVIKNAYQEGKKMGPRVKETIEIKETKTSADTKEHKTVAKVVEEVKKGAKH